MLRRLEAKGLVSAPDAVDARAMVVTLTGEGRARLTAALPDVEAADEAFFGALGEDRGAFIAVSRSSAGWRTADAVELVDGPDHVAAVVVVGEDQVRDPAALGEH